VEESIDDESWEYAYAILTFHTLGEARSTRCDDGGPGWKVKRTVEIGDSIVTVEFDSEEER